MTQHHDAGWTLRVAVCTVEDAPDRGVDAQHRKEIRAHVLSERPLRERRCRPAPCDRARKHVAGEHSGQCRRTAGDFEIRTVRHRIQAAVSSKRADLDQTSRIGDAFWCTKQECIGYRKDGRVRADADRKRG
jgi:hypothetical protein